MSTGWSLYVILLVVVSLVGCAWLLWVNRTASVDDVGQGEPLPSEHDGIVELNHPLPAWWSWLFVVTLVFAALYLVAYPGMGAFRGLLGWSSQGQYEAEVEQAEGLYGPIFAGYAAQPIPALVDDDRAVGMGQRLFLNHCATCHGSDARGGRGYPNLTDGDWLYGGAPEQIVASITHGRVGVMPPLGAALGGDPGVQAMAQYVLSLSGREHDAALAAQAAPQFATLCAVCHEPDGRGKQAMGAPNLTDDVWLHGGRLADIEQQIHLGRINQMPAHRDLLSPEKIHLLAAYVYGLSTAPDGVP
ncbi:MAG: cytochrome-c oxidase, cbb3-type subunit III [Proteobacteria bacterium]|nr:cytochrome-c oxidase, cbb3-type subunit III [Pseudomonadota bacterium]